LTESKQETTDAPKSDAGSAVEAPRFKKSVTKKGDRTNINNIPKKGDKVTVRYRGKLPDGKVFDSTMDPVKKKLPPPLSFKVGEGKVIRGWDEGILTMAVGELATFTIEPEWAYGKKGMPEAGIPPNATLIFEVELLSIS